VQSRLCPGCCSPFAAVTVVVIAHSPFAGACLARGFAEAPADHPCSVRSATAAGRQVMLATLTSLSLRTDNDPCPQLAESHREAACGQPSCPGQHRLRRGSVLERCRGTGTLPGMAIWQGSHRVGCSARATLGVGDRGDAHFAGVVMLGSWRRQPEHTVAVQDVGTSGTPQRLHFFSS